jgi:hypothetical protein
LQAAEIPCKPFDRGKFHEVLRELRGYTRREPFTQALNKVRQLCADTGVALVVTPELAGTRLSGAARWLTSDKALIQLSTRYRSDDQFWFSFFHEAGHLLNESGRRDYIDAAPEDEPGEANRDEQQADRFARDVLIPAEDYLSFADQAEFTAQSIRSFAQQQGIAPGVVVGRLQRDGRVPRRSHLNSLKRRIIWPR